MILSIRQTDVFFFSSELKNTKKKANLVGLDEKSGDICHGSLLVMAEWVYHCGIYEWPQVCGRKVGRRRDGPAGTLPLLSDVTPVQVRSV